MQSEMLQPFEDRASTPCGSSACPRPPTRSTTDTIADVLITIDYTALDSADYRAA